MLTARLWNGAYVRRSCKSCTSAAVHFAMPLLDVVKRTWLNFKQNHFGQSPDHPA
jgi:hypothetical protein